MEPAALSTSLQPCIYTPNRYGKQCLWEWRIRVHQCLHIGFILPRFVLLANTSTWVYVFLGRGGDWHYHYPIHRCIYDSVGSFISVFFEWSKTQINPTHQLNSLLLLRLILIISLHLVPTNGIVYGVSGLTLLLFPGHAKISVLELVIGGGHALVVCVVVAVTFKSCFFFLWAWFFWLHL